MNWKHVAALVFGVLLVLLGALWFLQGSDLIRLKPILCVADCEPLVSGSRQWQITGAVTFVLGIVALSLGVRGLRRRKKP